ncbi:MAG: Rpn family recombination-promoting nuclease/putative transposase [Cyanomargarita calcarea GSE-NOS-MK-12-04C]|jgi:predicted transposase/invertase (TIGR01784 family)|uniref:Rpn family recombination-promoting nuclease/putative transposase n=1 Tax=Cyanomargarita calcarea GSE-NOS-MK-12-04C TaxID=2839659 RepID=A0A951UVR5_9CYAN|nr:Rpn family recombination-promoting nuclease/putative transposase [Cyanomargarita calcarea GSE-NOS-MK-12-04C]
MPSTNQIVINTSPLIALVAAVGDLKILESLYTDTTLEEKVLEFIKAVVIDKFANLSREELEVMLNLDSLKKSKVYQEAKEEGFEEGKEEGKEEGSLETKLKTIPKLIKLGLSIEQIAESLELDVETVRNNTQT